MKTKFILMGLLLFCKVVYSKAPGHQSPQFDHEYNHFSGRPITHLKVCGERCSGTNFIMHLLHQNFHSLKQTGLLEFGQKHFLWWYGSTEYAKLGPLKYDAKAVTMEGSSHCLFVVVVRDPYDWLRSFFEVPWEVHHDLVSQGFSYFLQAQWKLIDTRGHPLDGAYKEIDNTNPWTGKPFENVLELRKYKILNYLALSKLVDHYVIVKYEDVRNSPEAFIEYIAEKTGLKKTPIFTPITTYKGSHIPYTPKKYPSFSEEDLQFINENLDWDVEDKVGYSLKGALNE